MSGLFVAVEGPEGAGKTTLVERLVRRLREAGFEVLDVREPGGTPTAEAARSLVLDPGKVWTPTAELFLILTARAELVEKVLRPALADGSTAVVISDRYDLSTEAYQIAGRGLPSAEVQAANRLATGGLEPDLTLVLDLDPEIGRTRQRTQGKALDRMELEDAEYHERVAAAFRDATGAGVVHLDGAQMPDQLEEAAWALVRARLGGTE